ncbi:MAG: dihydrolipoamide dehydrogenase [Flavobacteriaceae bacterium]|jgi:hypothetical protein|nr:dihydrolipoamide dehydrogenase [Flavobacteriaceae bacterium]
MKKLMIIVFVFAITSTVNAQVKTPQPSTSQTVTQTVGLTSLELSYSRPSMREREIFGTLVPYGEMWRTGANKNTTISFDKSVKIGSKIVKAGTYAIFTKPNAQSWEVYFYTETSNWGVPSEWDTEKVVASVKANVNTMPVKVETFTISFDSITNDSATLGFIWDNVYVGVPISFFTDAQVTESIATVMDGPNAGDYYSAAVYYLNAGKDIDKAKMWIDKAIKMRKNPAFWYYRQQSLIYAKSGDKKGAIKAAKESLKLAKEAGNNDYVALNTKSLSIWEGKKPVNK